MEGEWSCYGGGQFKGGEWSCYRGGQFDRENGHVREAASLMEGACWLQKWSL